MNELKINYMKLFNKKFRVKVCHYSRGRYHVKYASYRFIPIWECIDTYYTHMGFESESNGWASKLFRIDDAERLAKSLNCIQDVLDYEKPLFEKARKFKASRARYYEESQPYTTKYFNKNN